MRKKACGMVGRASNVRPDACECTCARPSRRICTSSITISLLQWLLILSLTSHLTPTVKYPKPITWKCAMNERNICNGLEVWLLSVQQTLTCTRKFINLPFLWGYIPSFSWMIVLKKAVPVKDRGCVADCRKLHIYPTT